jgi:hypothetical protein
MVTDDLDQNSQAASDARARSALTRLQDDYSQTLDAIMSMSDNDLIIGASLALRNESPNQSPEDWARTLKEAETRASAEENVTEYLDRLKREIVGELPEERRRRQDAKDALIREQKNKALTAAQSHSDTLVVTCFEEAKLKKNVAALSTGGKIQIFGRVLTNVLETRTRMITIQPITLSGATES